MVWYNLTGYPVVLLPKDGPLEIREWETPVMVIPPSDQVIRFMDHTKSVWNSQESVIPIREFADYWPTGGVLPEEQTGVGYIVYSHQLEVLHQIEGLHRQDLFAPRCDVWHEDYGFVGFRDLGRLGDPCLW